MERRLLSAAENGQVEDLLLLLQAHPNLINSTDTFGWTALHSASCNGRTEVVKLLLAHPTINVNLQNSLGQTAISYSCLDRRVSVLQLLLLDPRVNVSLADFDNRSPLWWASRQGFHEVIVFLIASGKDLGDLTQKGKGGDNGKGCTALEIARSYRHTEVALLLKRFMDNPTQTRHEVRGVLGLQDELAAELFAVIIFLCDGILRLNQTIPAPATRFFGIASQLPMELQMILCHRTFGSGKQNIVNKDSEAAFKGLAKGLETRGKSSSSHQCLVA